MPTTTIRDYLVSLGFAVDNVSERKFGDALKKAGVAVERFSKGAIEGFAIAGGAFVAAAAAVTGATIGMLRSTARQDLEFQVLARRMLMTTDATRKMKMATDALGYSIEEIIWGPPELAERYHQLIKDETAMLSLLGSDKGEAAFRHIRDIEFQFTRIGPALQIFGMRLTEDVLNKLSGTPMSLENRLKSFIDWFEGPSGFVKISDVISGVIAPALTTMWHLFTKSWDAAVGIAHAVGAIFSGKTTDTDLVGLRNNPLRLSDSALAGSIDSVTGVNRHEEEGRREFGGSGWMSRLKEMFSGHNYVQEIIDAAHKYGIPSSILMAIGQKESGLNPFAPMGGKGEIGEFQLMPQTVDQLRAKGIIKDPYDPSQNIEGGAYWLSTRGGKNWYDKIRAYNGSGPQADAYAQSVVINIQHMNATPEEVKKAVQDGMAAAKREADKRLYTHAQGAYAH